MRQLCTALDRERVIVLARLKKLGWAKENLVLVARATHTKSRSHDLRSQTTMSLKWIARHLEMGSWTHVSNLLR
jgi:hypothetical protein